MPYRLICKLTLLFVLIFGSTASCANQFLDVSRPEGVYQIPAPTGWVNDFANVFNVEHKTKLTALIEELREKTGAEIIVVTVSSIAPYDEKEYARLIFDNWKPGKKDKDNGVLVLLAITERRWRIETGYGLEGILPDGKCGEIGRNYMAPYLKQGRYGEGIYSGVLQISKIIAENSHAELSNIKNARTKGISSTAGPMMFFLPIFSLGFFLVWNIPWPIFIGLPFTLLFAFAFSRTMPWIGIFPVLGYIGAMVIRYFIWNGIPPAKRKSFLWFLIFGFFALPTGNYGGSRWGGFNGGGFRGGGFSGGGGGFGGGGGGGGGAGGGF